MKYFFGTAEKSRYSLCVLIVLTFCVSLCNAADTCEICGGKITGRYYTYQKEGSVSIVCADCAENMGLCSVCGIPVAGTRVGDTGVICRECRLNARKCNVCNAFLTGKYYLDDAGHAFCESCYEQADRCHLCRNILLPGEWQYEDGRQVCNTCRTGRQRCFACNRLIVGQYSVHKGFNGVFCQSCSDHTPSCISCMRPCGPTPSRLRNGHHICADCLKTAIMDKRALETVITDVSHYMERHLLMTIEHAIDFRLVDSLNGNHSRTNYREAGRFIRYNDDFTIKILNGLSYALCIETISHELAHAWQAENSPNLPSDELVEGFAQWVSGKVLLGMGYPDLIERLHYRDDVYGKGYRLLVKMEKEHGFSGVFRELERLGRVEP